MKPRISLITLGVDDLEESLRFYRDGLGLATQGIIGTEFEYGAVVFFDLQANLKLNGTYLSCGIGNSRPSKPLRGEARWSGRKGVRS